MIVVLAALYVVFVAGAKPVVQFGAPSGTSSMFMVTVASVSRGVSTSSYRMNLVIGGVAGTPVTVTMVMTLTVAGTMYMATFGDLTFDGQITRGDMFVVTPAGTGSFQQTTHELQLLWSDGSVVGSATYTPGGGGAPTATFSSPQPITNGFEASLASVSRTFPASSYELTLQEGANSSPAVAVTASMTFWVGADRYNGTWVDLGGEGSLTAGDSILVTHAGGLPQATNLTLHLWWAADGTEIASVNWST